VAFVAAAQIQPLRPQAAATWVESGMYGGHENIHSRIYSGRSIHVCICLSSVYYEVLHQREMLTRTTEKILRLPTQHATTRQARRGFQASIIHRIVSSSKPIPQLVEVAACVKHVWIHIIPTKCLVILGGNGRQIASAHNILAKLRETVMVVHSLIVIV